MTKQQVSKQIRLCVGQWLTDSNMGQPSSIPKELATKIQEAAAEILALHEAEVKELKFQIEADKQIKQSLKSVADNNEKEWQETHKLWAHSMIRNSKLSTQLEELQAINARQAKELEQKPYELQLTQEEFYYIRGNRYFENPELWDRLFKTVKR